MKTKLKGQTVKWILQFSLPFITLQQQVANNYESTLA